MQPSLITLFGSTGYTGRRIAGALNQAGLPFRIAGRSEERLRALSDQLANHPSWVVADALQPASLPPLFQNTRLLINCAGPFTDLGERVIAQAAMNGVHYLDITNELGYVFRARSYNELAQRTGAALVPACGFEVALADCLIHACADQFGGSGSFDSVTVVYDLRGNGSSAGTRRSAVRSLGTSWITYHNGEWRGRIPGGRVQRFNLPAGPQYALEIPSSESVSVPLYLGICSISTWMTTSPAARFLAPIFIPILARLSRSILRGPILSIADRGGQNPADAQAETGNHTTQLSAGSPFTIFIEIKRGNHSNWASLTGHDPYGLTAELAAYYAAQLVHPGYDRKGILAPSQAVDFAALLAYGQAHWGLKVQMEGGGT